MKEKPIKTRLFCRFKNAVFGAVAVALSLVTACGGHPPANSSSSDLVGRVVKVADGDTITILETPSLGQRASRPLEESSLGQRASRPLTQSPTQHTIRLQGIDAPEKGQAFGNASGRFLSSLVAGREVRVTWTKRDKYNRILGTVFVGGKEVNLEMLKAGLAWHYKRFDSTPAYAQAEATARAAKKGLWADKNPIPPEQFRHPDRVVSPVKVEVTSSTNGKVSERYFSSNRVEYRAGGKMPVGSRTPAPVCDQWPDTGYWLSTNSNKRHNRKCENYRKTRGYPCQKNEGERCGKCGG